ncbi:MAG: hypothetical protein K6G58_02735 [Lachnospiraceae bacterium]|nr:hypothetical protein [Lachnospiraceae bacterium]
MQKTHRIGQRIIAVISALVLFATGMPQTALAEGPSPEWDPPYSYTYTANAKLMDAPGDALACVYEAKAVRGAKKDSATLGIPSIAKQNLESMPTTESPAIIQGAAVPFEKRVNTSHTIRFDRINDDPIYAPYSYFRYQLMEEPDANGTGTHTKISGYDGTFVIIRVDVSQLIEEALDDIRTAKEEHPEDPAPEYYLHYQQTNNKALLVALGEEVAEDENGKLSVKFADQSGGQAGCFSLRDNALSLKDKDGKHTDTPYVDIILVSSGALVEGADKGNSEGKALAPTPDFPVSFYVDQENDYNPEIEWDSATNSAINVKTREPVGNIMSSDGKTVLKTPEQQMMEKYYNEDKAKKKAAEKGKTLPDDDFTSYCVKGDDLELEVMVDETVDDVSTETEYWSLRRAMDYQPYSHHTVSLMCEVPMLEGLLVDDTEGANDREVVLDVNSFDIQVANNTETGAGQSLAVKALKPGKVKITGYTCDGSNKKVTVTVTVVDASRP